LKAFGYSECYTVIPTNHWRAVIVVSKLGDVHTCTWSALIRLYRVNVVQTLFFLFTKAIYAHAVYTTVQFLSLLHVSAITSPSSGSITHQVI
jgi:hypothetical protein